MWQRLRQKRGSCKSGGYIAAMSATLGGGSRVFLGTTLTLNIAMEIAYQLKKGSREGVVWSVNAFVSGYTYTCRSIKASVDLRSKQEAVHSVVQS